MQKPPAGVKLTMETVCIMFEVAPARVPAENGVGKVDDYWEPAKKKVLMDPKLMDKLLTYDKDNIDPKIIEKVTPYTLKKEFEPDQVKRASKAAEGLCKWVRAMVVYDKVAKVIAPRKAALAEAEAALASAEA
jgi:dynein heavy chain